MAKFGFWRGSSATVVSNAVLERNGCLLLEHVFNMFENSGVTLLTAGNFRWGVQAGRTNNP